MKNRFCLWLAACLVLLMGISLSVHAKSASVDRSALGFTEADQAYYLTDELFTLIAPGIDFELIDFTIPADRQPEVTFTVIDAVGDPLEPDDFDPAFNPLREVNLRFMLTYIPIGEENKVNYHDRFRDSGGVYTDMGGGVYMYKFATVLPEGYETDATHTLGSVATRDLRTRTTGLEPDLGRYYDNDVYNFVPSGSGEPMPRDITATATCNNCHNPLGMHGGRYQEVQVCTQCHNPDVLGGEGDELSYELSALVHRVHSGNEPQLGEVHFPASINDCQVCHTPGGPTVDMPLAVSPNPITSCGSGVGMTTLEWSADGSVEVRIGSTSGQLFAQGGAEGSKATGNWVKDGMDFFLLDRASGETLQKQNVDLTVYGCAGNAPYTYANSAGTAGEIHASWMTRPNREACGGCHVNINWETGEGHAGGAQEDDEFCSFCHAADSGEEFDRSVAGAHTQPLASAVLGGVYVDIKEVTDAGPGQRPTVLFSLTSKRGPIDPSTLDRLLFTLTGPNEDFDFYAQENVLSGLTRVGSDWSYTFSATVPMDAEGSYSVGFEGRITTEVNGENERDSAENYIVPVAVTDAEAEARRLIVDDAKCEACHSNLSLHGDNRKNASMYCQTCHRPDATDEEVRLEGENESIHFKYMVHKIHRGAELENLPYIIYGYRSSVHDYSDVHFPGDLRDCETCHVNDSYNLPLPEGAANTHAPSAFIPDMGPETATCLSCHDGFTAAAHASANTGALGESCSACHGDGKTYSVERVHAR
jgi:formylmethanofuran dehydrogenase subunit E